jgi:hypothetical protein
VLEPRPEVVQTTVFRVEERLKRKVDLLVVMDDSPAMGPFAGGVRARLPGMLRALSLASPAHYHIGVITSDTYRRPLIDFIDVDQVTGRNNLAPGEDLETAFLRLTDVGTSGAQDTEPLEASWRALMDASQREGGFLREEALLIVLFIAATDDGSPGPDSKYISFFGGPGGIKRNPLDVAVYAIDGFDERCAPPASRLNRVVLAMPAPHLRRQVTSLCADDYSGALAVLSEQILCACVPSCLYAPLTSVESPDCVVYQRTHLRDGSLAVRPLPPCSPAGPPCWRFTTSPQCAPICAHEGDPAQRLLFEIDRGPDRDPPINTVVVAECVTAPTTSFMCRAVP